MLLPFVYGLRFDLSTMMIANIIFIILSLIPISHVIFKPLLKIVFVFGNLFALSVNIIDIEFFKFNGKKLTLDILGIQNDISSQIVQLAMYYWYFLVLVAVFGILLWFFYPVSVNIRAKFKKVHFAFTPIIALVILIFSFVVIRGGVQMRSISPKEAFIFDRHELGNIALNSAYTLVRSLDRKGVEKIMYFKSDSSVRSKIKQVRTFSSEYKGHPKQNIIIIIVESLTQEYIDDGYTPFFSTLAEQGLYFNQNFANGRRSIEVLPSIFTGMPSIIGEPISQSQYQTIPFLSLPQVLKNNDYDLSFFHGGETGTMDFDAYTQSIGIDKYFGKEDYLEQEYARKVHYDGNWGIYDHYFFSYMIQYLNTLPKNKNFFSTLFTLSSHQPYSIPIDLQNKFKKGSLAIHQSIGYADYSLKTFFKKAKKFSWYKNTLFIITADHTQQRSRAEFLNTLGQFRVPLLFFHPTIDLTKQFKDKKRVTQHADIYSSVLDFLDIKISNKLLYGTSVFGKDLGRMINFDGHQYHFFKKPFLATGIDDNFKAYKVSDDLSSLVLVNGKTQDTKSIINELKLYIQYTQNGLLFNSLYTDP